MLKFQLRLQQDQITGFSYSFSKLLLDRLNALFTENTFYTKYDNGAPREITDTVKNICYYLEKQMPYSKWLNVVTSSIKNVPDHDEEWQQKGQEELEKGKEEIKAIIDAGYDFLATFEVTLTGATSPIPASLADVLKTPLEELELSVRAFNCLRSAKIKSLTELVQYTAEELVKFRNFGQKSLIEIEETLEARGLKFGMNI